MNTGERTLPLRRVLGIAVLSTLLVGVLLCEVSIAGSAASSPAPIVTALSPSSGPAGGGAGSTYWGEPVVVIDGSNFSDVTSIQFGSDSLPPSQFVVLSSSEISLETPPAPVGTVADVNVTTPAGTSPTTSADRFIYTADTSSESGYWEVAADGGIFSFGNAPFLGSMGGQHLNAPVVGMAVDQSGTDLGIGGLPPLPGYWEVASDGGIFSFGEAPFYGSMGGTHLNSPIVGMALDATTGGYWEVAADGGVFSFNAPFFGSLGGTHPSSPIVGMAQSGDGYWLAAANGTVYAFGGAPNLGSLASPRTPVVGMAADPLEVGYSLVTADGTVTPFGSGQSGGSSAIGPLNKPIVGMATYGESYWEVGADGGIFGSPFYGSMGGIRLNATVVGMAAVPQPTRTGPD